MRELLFRNLTSGEGKRKILASTEISEKEGMRSVVRRHLVCIVREVAKPSDELRPVPTLSVLKERNSREQKERFFCRIKGSVYAVHNGKVFLIEYLHSLKIHFMAVTPNYIKFA